MKIRKVFKVFRYLYKEPVTYQKPLEATKDFFMRAWEKNPFDNSDESCHNRGIPVFKSNYGY